MIAQHDSIVRSAVLAGTAPHTEKSNHRVWAVFHRICRLPTLAHVAVNGRSELPHSGRRDFSNAENCDPRKRPDPTGQRGCQRYNAASPKPDRVDGSCSNGLTTKEGNLRDNKAIEMMEHSQPFSRGTPSNVRAVLHQSPDKRGVPLPVKMVSQLTQTWHSQVRSFC